MLLKLALSISSVARSAVAIVGDWLLETGFWDDTGVWRDDATWND